MKFHKNLLPLLRSDTGFCGTMALTTFSRAVTFTVMI
jgi:hypothetical protein